MARGLIPLFVLAHFGHHLISALLTPLLPFIRDEFSLDYTQAGWLVSAYTLAYGFSQLPAGWMADRFGPRLLITIGISGVALCGLVIGLSPGYFMIVIFLILLGIMGGGYHPAASPLVSTLVPPQKRGRALGIHQIGGTLSFFLAPLVAAGTAKVLGWRGSFLAISIPTLAFGIVFYLLLGRSEYAKKTKPQAASVPAEVLPTQGRWRPLVAMVTLGVVSMVLIYSAISFIPLFLVDHFSVSKEVAAAMLALTFSGGLWAGPLGGYVSDRVGRVPVMLSAGLIGGLTIYLMNLVPFGWSLSAILIIIGMAQHLGMPVVEAYIISHTSERRRSTVLGIYYFASRGGPGVIAPAIGYLIDHYGFYASFSIVGAVTVAVTIFCALFLWGSRD